MKYEGFFPPPPPPSHPIPFHPLQHTHTHTHGVSQSGHLSIHAAPPSLARFAAGNWFSFPSGKSRAKLWTYVRTYIVDLCMFMCVRTTKPDTDECSEHLRDCFLRRPFLSLSLSAAEFHLRFLEKICLLGRKEESTLWRSRPGNKFSPLPNEIIYYEFMSEQDPLHRSSIKCRPMGKNYLRR